MPDRFLFDPVREHAHVVLYAPGVAVLMPEVTQHFARVPLFDHAANERFVKPYAMTQRLALNADRDIMYHHLLFVNGTDRPRAHREAALLAEQVLNEL